MRKLKGLSTPACWATCSACTATSLGVIRSNENALWSLGVHDLSVILWLLGEEPDEAVAHGRFPRPSRHVFPLPPLRVPGRSRTARLTWLDHTRCGMTVVGREKMAVFDDMELERKITVYEKAPWEPAETGEWRTRTGDIFSPKIANDEPLRLEVEHFLSLVEADRATTARHWTNSASAPSIGSRGRSVPTVPRPRSSTRGPFSAA